jgi:hypothetical protein
MQGGFGMLFMPNPPTRPAVGGVGLGRRVGGLRRKQRG